MNKIDDVLEYIDRECIGVEQGTGRHGFNYDKATSKLEQYVLSEKVKLLEQGYQLNIDILKVAEYKAGFQDAIDQITLSNEIRIKELSAQQAKEANDE